VGTDGHLSVTNDREHANHLTDSMVPQGPPCHPVTTSRHPSDAETRGACCAGVARADLPADLAQLVDAWPNLSEAVRAEILALVDAAKREGKD
jgi:hypothetical protein